MRFLVLSAILALVCGFVAAEVRTATLYRGSDGDYSLIFGKQDTEGVAWASFDDALETKGWGELKIRTNRAFKDTQQSYAAGYLEGALTANRIYENHQSMSAFWFKNSSIGDIYVKFVEEQEKWMAKKIAHKSKKSAFWRQVSYVSEQFEGLVDGYNAHCDQDKALPRMSFHVLNHASRLIAGRS
eukprot:Colp12_sorted_trinity150504_noHs@9576